MLRACGISYPLRLHFGRMPYAPAMQQSGLRWWPTMLKKTVKNSENRHFYFVSTFFPCEVPAVSPKILPSLCWDLMKYS